MTKMNTHPTVQRVRDRMESAEVHAQARINAETINAGELRQICQKAGADDVGFVSIDRPEIADQRSDILSLYPKTKTLISLVCRMHREPLRSTARSAANLEFDASGEQVNHASREIVRHLEERGIGAVNAAMGFPMEMGRFPGKIWMVSHKPVAVAAGLGQMGIHRNVIHPRYGNFILLGTVLMEAQVSEEASPIEYNPCVDCKLCVSACPVGAISPEGSFNFSSCYTHNYREFMGGFTDWVEDVAESKTKVGYRNRVSDSESASMWQSLSFGANYKAAYCLSVCPAGEDVMAPFLTDRKQFLSEVVRPLQEKEETLYVVPKSDAEDYAKKRFPHKSIRYVGGRSASDLDQKFHGDPAACFSAWSVSRFKCHVSSALYGNGTRRVHSDYCRSHD